jgi:Na+/H+ antiporter NhaD/arsenite permease-like protein
MTAIRTRPGPERRRSFLALAASSVLIAAVAFPVAPSSGPPMAEAAALGTSLPLWSVIPFAGILLSIALFPLVRPHFWHHHYPKVAVFWAFVFAIPFLIAFGGPAFHEIVHTLLVDYVPFLILLWALFAVAGGIVVRGTFSGTPGGNSCLLLVGTLLASLVGTTGASMLLIRPVLRANAWRSRKAHVVIFFIFLVSNIGGCLTPLGDPPLFLGFLHGVPFGWTFSLALPMLVLVVFVTAVFVGLDSYWHRREEKRHPAGKGGKTRLAIGGGVNLLFLAGILLGVFQSGLWSGPRVLIFGVAVELQNIVRDATLVLMGFLSVRLTARRLREENGFNWAPIREVAILFFGIFMTIIPAIAILKAGAEGGLHPLMRRVTEPLHYFWATGGLSSFLDNAPTYLTFFNTALGSFGFPGTEVQQVAQWIGSEREVFLLAISVGAVFMGANTYIGNAPNFMVKSIAEEAGIPMPSFFGYLLRYSLPVLVPGFVVLTLIFF